MDKQPSPPPGISWIIESWRRGQRPNAQEVLAEHPELSNSTSVILNLALEEYCLRREAGEQVAQSTFCDRFPTVRGELRLLLDVEQHLPDDAPVWPEVGDAFLEFDLEAQLGEGAAARVFLARQRTLGNRYVALKVSPFGANEAATLGKLQHPHVVPVLSVHFDEQRGLTAVCMPYLGGATLLDVCRHAFENGPPERADVILQAAANCQQLGEYVRGEAPAAELLRSGTYIDGIVHLVAELCEGLAYTHAQGVLHRDLKPSNVLVTPHGRPMLLDFNLSRDRDLERTRMGGTLPYMPPEQVFATFFVDSEMMTDDPRSDIYSVGVILYQMLTNRLPFAAANPTNPNDVQNYLFAQTAGAEDVRRLNPAIPARLAELIAECLDTTIKCRPPSADVLAARLRSLLPAPRVPTNASIPVRTRPWLALGATATLVVAGAAFVSLAGTRSGPFAPVPATSSSEITRPPPPSFEDLLEEARQLCAQGLFSEAEQRLTEAQQLNPQESLREYFAYCAYEQGNVDRTILLLRQEQESRQTSAADLLNNLADCAFRKGNERDRSVALALLDSALEACPEHKQALLNRALCNVRISNVPVDTDGGIALLKKAIKQYHSVPPALRFEAVHLYAAAIQRRQGSRDELVAEMKEHLHELVRLGYTTRQIKSRYLDSLKNEPWLSDFKVSPTSTSTELPPTHTFSHIYYVRPPRWQLSD